MLLWAFVGAVYGIAVWHRLERQFVRHALPTPEPRSTRRPCRPRLGGARPALVGLVRNASMSGNRPTTWHEYRRQRTRCLLICLGGVPAAALLGLIVPAAFPILVIAWFAGSLWSSMVLSYFKCPRCGKPFIIRASGGYNGFARKCLNCGLPKWSEPA